MDALVVASSATDTNVYHHMDAEPRLSVELARNSRGVNWTISTTNLRSVEQAEALLRDALKSVRQVLADEGLVEGAP